jgi:hypothetical protein
MAKPKAAAPDPNNIGARKEMTIAAATPEQARRDIARLITAPEFAAARTIQAAEGRQGYGAQLDTLELVASLRARSDKVNANDLGDVERMLANQATTLQSLFVRLAERGMNAELLPHYEAHMRLALRAQSQCRATLETLATIKNPPIVFARQANIAQQQQVNNGPAVPTRAREVSPAHNELLEQAPHERLEFGTQGAASGADSQLATVGTVHRPQD